MSDWAVQARGISKRFELGEASGGYELLSERIMSRVRREPPAPSREFWALEDVDFEVRAGESFGIVGHNGAGKSTLLKILSRVTPVTRGEVDLYGRVGALLEVGTGFHPELTGAENIYLNGAVLGLRREEVARRFDEIVAFAEVERFVYTPVKRYSSGMFLRLAFAVAAHLEPDILIVDEVLSVGDLAFQEKCLGRMRTVTGEGRTVLFVSHNLAAVDQLCDRAMLLERGRKIAEGTTTEVIGHYVQSLRREASLDLAARDDRSGSGRLRFQSMRLHLDGEPSDTLMTGRDAEFLLDYTVGSGEVLRNANFSVSISTLLGETMLHLYTVTRGELLRDLPPTGTVRCAIPRLPLPAGQYLVTLWADVGGTAGEVLDWIQRAAELTVAEGDYFGTGRPALASHPAVLVEHTWDLVEPSVVSR
jgi:lipopolysaccharide transport system ATP-binding protein